MRCNKSLTRQGRRLWHIPGICLCCILHTRIMQPPMVYDSELVLHISCRSSSKLDGFASLAMWQGWTPHFTSPELSEHVRRQADALDVCASTNFLKKKMCLLNYGLVTWISKLLTSNGRSKCRSLRTIIPPSRLWSRSSWYSWFTYCLAIWL